MVFLHSHDENLTMKNYKYTHTATAITKNTWDIKQSVPSAANLN